MIVTNKTTGAGKVARFHERRGYQEKIYVEEPGADGRAVWWLTRFYLLCSLLAHNLSRELQMQIQESVRGTTQKRTVKWVFEGLDTLRRTVIARAGV